MDIDLLRDFSLKDPSHPLHLVHMEMALEEAGLALDADEVPIGAIVVSSRRGVIGRAHNERESLRDPTAHAEILAITQAASALRSWRLEHCMLYVTLEPCPMCAGAVLQARIPWVVYGAADPKAGACHSLFELLGDPRLNHRALVIGGVLENRCAEMLSSFFAAKRRGGKN